jgi:hypothetical protein
MSLRFLLVAFLLVGQIGCSGPQGAKSPPSADALSEAKGDENAKKPVGAPEQAPATATPQPQMIVYTATLSVVVKDLDTAAHEAEKLVAGHKGFVAKSEVRGDPGTPRVATYTLRVPVANFSALKAGLLDLGNADRNAVESQDVTEEFVDVEARIKNLQEQERKLNELLQEKRKEEKLEDVIRVSDRIYGVRGDIERAQGRRNYLLNRAQLSTIHLTLREIKDYKPPTASTFGTRIGETFATSWESVVKFGQGVVLFAVALAPWTPLLLPLVVLAVWGVRRWIRLSHETSVHNAPHHPRRLGIRPDELPPETKPAEQPNPPEGEATA